MCAKSFWVLSLYRTAITINYSKQLQADNIKSDGDNGPHCGITHLSGGLQELWEGDYCGHYESVYGATQSSGGNHTTQAVILH